jgi:hypothetical protein
MLPFLKNKHEASISETPDLIKREHDEDSADEYDMLESAAEDLISAIHSKDVKAVCSALRASHELLDLEPHHEANHEDE